MVKSNVPIRRSSGPLRRGSAYVLVLGVAMLVFVIGVGSMAVVSAQARANGANTDAAEARLYALSAIDLGRLFIAQDANWRTNRVNGTWISNQVVGAGTCSLDVVNPNGLLNRSLTDPVVLTGTGVKGLARQVVQVTLSPTVIPSPCLNKAIITNGNMVFNNAYVVPVSHTIACNGNMSSTSSSINVDVEAGGTITGSTYAGVQTAAAPKPTMPSSTIFDYYIANGTTITIPSGKIKDQLLTPARNPWGSLNANGIYIVDCGGTDIVVENSRIAGTLVLLEPGAGSIIQMTVNLTPVVANYPCLLVRGNITIELNNADGNVLDEATVNVNFNRAGNPYPYPSGTTDSALNDSYPNGFQGWVYVSGNVTVVDSASFRNLIVGNSLGATGTLYINPDPTLKTSPPPGLYSVSTPVLTGSWTQVVN